MDVVLSTAGAVLIGVLVGVVAIFVHVARHLGFRHAASLLRFVRPNQQLVPALIQAHFAPTRIDDISIATRRFPFRVRVDLQRSVERLFDGEIKVANFCGVRREIEQFGTSLSLSDCLTTNSPNPALSSPPECDDIDIGEEKPIRCLKNGLWFVTKGDERFVVLLSAGVDFGACGLVRNLQAQIATVNNPAGAQLADQFFKHLEEAVLRSESYRGKILSLEQAEDSYTGASTGITVHKLRTVEREQVILPKKTLDLLDRNVIHFVRQRPQLARFRLATKKGILFYGPPGTGKTHTIHYLARALEGHTTLLITAEQVGLLAEYMTLARLLQPSIVVIEDVDLIAGERTKLRTSEEILLNKLLNEMDGLKEEADILFILTTNRPETLERALASRPGRIDQAIEFPLPDDEGRRKLVRLYSQGVDAPDEVVQATVRKTEKVSAAFIKELMRRSVQFHLERNGTGRIELMDVESALEEMLFSGGKLNLKLLGAAL